MSASPSGAARLYRELILAEAPRVLGMMDREELSPSAGCCDRTYWAWKFVDFPRSRFQEALCVLSFLYAEPFEGNVYRGDVRLCTWIEAGLAFWVGLQHGDGSFDEAYPFERSLAATAFTSFYVAEALHLLGDELESELRARVVDALVRAGDWLCRNDETHGLLSNHLAAAAAALAQIAELGGHERHRARSAYFTRRILDRQSAEGWYEEYGGADPGYQTHGSFYLARLLELGEDQELASSLERSLGFLAVFVHPDGSIGGEYASRNTKTYYPAAFEMLAARSPSAAWIARTMRPAVASGTAAGLLGIDAFNYFPCLNNLVFAYLAVAHAAEPAQEAAQPRADEPFVWFPEAGIARIRHQAYEAVVGTSKGGVLLVFDRREGRLAHSDCGFIGRMRGGAAASTQVLNHEREVVATASRIEVHGRVHALARPTMKPLRFVLFRLFSLTLGRFAGPGRWLKRQLVRALIQRTSPLDVIFVRRIRFEESEVVVTDEMRGFDVPNLEGLRRGEIFTTIHMGSARYFVPGELLPPCPQEGEAWDVYPPTLVQGVTLERRLPIG